MIEKLVIIVLMACIVGWNFIAWRMSPLARNIASLTAIGLAFLFFLILREWKINGGIFMLLLTVHILAEKYPKNIDSHKYKREKVTFLQDFLFRTGAIMLCFEIYEMMIILKYV